MKKEHKYAQAFRWIADGENLQIRWGKHPRWIELPERNEVIGEILRGAEDYEFRIKPRTMKIGNREIAAPLPVVSTETTAEGFTTDNYGKPHHWWGTTQFGQDLLKAGRVFATADDAVDAYNAVSELLRGEE